MTTNFFSLVTCWIPIRMLKFPHAKHCDQANDANEDLILVWTRAITIAAEQQQNQGRGDTTLKILEVIL